MHVYSPETKVRFWFESFCLAPVDGDNRSGKRNMLPVWPCEMASWWDGACKVTCLVITNLTCLVPNVINLAIKRWFVWESHYTSSFQRLPKFYLMFNRWQLESSAVSGALLLCEQRFLTTSHTNTKDRKHDIGRHITLARRLRPHISINVFSPPPLPSSFTDGHA